MKSKPASTAAVAADQKTAAVTIPAVVTKRVTGISHEVATSRAMALRRAVANPNRATPIHRLAHKAKSLALRNRSIASEKRKSKHKMRTDHLAWKVRILFAHFCSNRWTNCERLVTTSK
jgi:hypothetical protein